MINWKSVQRTFYAAGGAGTVILIFSAILAIWGIFDIDAYWRAMASIGVIIFTSLVCAGTAGLLEKYEVPPTGSIVASAQNSVWSTLRNAAGMFVITIFTVHGIFGFYAVWMTLDNMFARAALSAMTFLLGLLILSAFSNAMQYGTKSAHEYNSNLYALSFFLTIALLVGISFL